MSPGSRVMLALMVGLLALAAGLWIASGPQPWPACMQLCDPIVPRPPAAARP